MPILFTPGQMVDGVLHSDAEMPRTESICFTNGAITEDGITTELPAYECRMHNSGVSIFPKQDVDWLISGEHAEPFDKYWVRCGLPMRHAICSGMGQWTEPTETGLMASVKRVLGGISGALTPTISVRIDHTDPLSKHLKIDPDFPLVAVRTDRAISPRYIGLRGILTQGLNRNIWSRIQQHPTKAMIGATRLVALAGMVYFVYILVLF